MKIELGLPESQYIYPKLRRIRLPQSVINRYLSVFAAAAAQRTSAAAATNRGREKSCWVVAQRFAVGWNQQQQQFRSLFISLSRLAGLPKIKWTKAQDNQKLIKLELDMTTLICCRFSGNDDEGIWMKKKEAKRSKFLIVEKSQRSKKIATIEERFLSSLA